LLVVVVAHDKAMLLVLRRTMAAESSERSLRCIYGATKWTIKAAAMIPIRKQAAAMISV
jgi:hypothetical protein